MEMIGTVVQWVGEVVPENVFYVAVDSIVW